MVAVANPRTLSLKIALTENTSLMGKNHRTSTKYNCQKSKNILTFLTVLWT